MVKLDYSSNENFPCNEKIMNVAKTLMRILAFINLILYAICRLRTLLVIRKDRVRLLLLNFFLVLLL